MVTPWRTVPVTTWSRLLIEFLSENNILDAEGIKKINQLTAAQNQVQPN